MEVRLSWRNTGGVSSCKCYARLLETFSMAEVSAAARQALHIQEPRHLLRCAVKAIYCCVQLSVGFRSWIWKTIRTCRAAEVAR